MLTSQISFVGAVEEGGEQGIQGALRALPALGLQALQRVHLRLQRVQFGHDLALLGQRRQNQIEPSRTKTMSSTRGLPRTVRLLNSSSSVRCAPLGSSVP